MRTMTKSQSIWPGYELTVDVELIPITTNIPEPDPAWRFVDGEGHGHFYDPTAKNYPTLRWVSLPCTMGHDDCDSEGYHECAVCGERITPGTRMPMPTSMIGPTTYRLTVDEGDTRIVYVFGQEQFDALKAAIATTVSETLADCVAEWSVGH